MFILEARLRGAHLKDVNVNEKRFGQH